MFGVCSVIIQMSTKIYLKYFVYADEYTCLIDCVGLL